MTVEPLPEAGLLPEIEPGSEIAPLLETGLPRKQPGKSTEGGVAHYAPHARAERVIASGRACLALFGLAGILLDPLDPETFAAETLSLLAVYSAYALVFWISLARGATASRRTALAAHVFDLAVAVTLTAISRGSGSPFFLFFAFLLVCAAVRWAGRGVWWTGAVVMVAYGVVGACTAAGFLTPEFEVNPFIVRMGLLLVMTTVLVQVGGYHSRLYAELQQLARWPRAARESLDDVLREGLGHAAATLEVNSALLIWESGTPGLRHHARWSGGRLDRWDAETHGWTPDVVESLLIDARTGSIWLVANSDPPRAVSRTAVDGHFIGQHGIETAIATPLRGPGVDGRHRPAATPPGWLFLVNRLSRPVAIDDAVMAELLAAELAGALERWQIQRRTRDAALGEERLRVARDLHDGVLQSLTGSRLAIVSAAGAADSVLPAVAGELRLLERAMAHEQQELRRFIQHLRPESQGPHMSRGAPLADLCRRVEGQWRIAVTIEPGSESAVPPDLSTQVLLLAHEALVNAAKHAQATTAHVGVSREGDRLRLVIRDDGRGFPFHGRFDGEELRVLDAGPRTLRERTRALRGRLTLLTSPGGTTIAVELPVVATEPVCA